MDGDPTTVNLDPYICPAGYWTIGWGHLVGGRRITKDQMSLEEVRAKYYPDGITLEQAEELLNSDLKTMEVAVETGCQVELNDNQFSALVSFCFNVGPGEFLGSTLLKLLNKDDYKGAASQLDRWVHVTDQETKKKVVSDGLVRRRRTERALFERPVFKEPAPPSVKVTRQVVKVAAVAVGTAVVQANDQIPAVQTALHAIGFQPQWLVPAFGFVALAAWAVSAFYDPRKAKG